MIIPTENQGDWPMRNLREGMARVEKAMAPHSSTLAWKIPWTEESGGLQSMGSLRVGHNWATSLSLFTVMHGRRKWQPTPVFLHGESHGQGNLVGCHLWGRTETDTTEVTYLTLWQGCLRVGDETWVDSCFLCGEFLRWRSALEQLWWWAGRASARKLYFHSWARQRFAVSQELNGAARSWAKLPSKKPTCEYGLLGEGVPQEKAVISQQAHRSCWWTSYGGQTSPGCFEEVILPNPLGKWQC